MSVDFKLFGNFLSLWEFLFIAVGLALAWFFWFLMQQGVIPGIIAIPISFTIGGGGILVGLVPINDRSLDKWIVDYLAAIKRPTQRVWRKPGYQPNIATSDSEVIRKDHIVAPPTQTQGVFSSAPLLKPQQKQIDVSIINVERAETAELERISQSLAAVSNGQENTAATPPNSNTQAAALSATSGNDIVSSPSPILPPNTPTPTMVENNPPEISGSISLNPHQPKDNTVPARQVSGSASSPQIQFSDGPFPAGVTVLPQAQSNTPIVNPVPVPPSQHPAPVPQQPKEEHPTKVIVIDDNKINDYATTIPGIEEKQNTLNIVVKDANGLIMPSVVCVIKNAHGDPVRAAISNILGQIVNNIPLKDGMYKISLSKQGYFFPEVTRTLTGKVYPPIEIKAL